MATALQFEFDPHKENARNTWRDRTEAYKLRAIPNEDVYFYSKKIDNSKLVRPVDPVSRRRAWGMMTAGVGCAVIVMFLMLPHLMNLMAGMQLHRLEAEKQDLIREHDAIEFQEAELMAPERMKAIARKRNMVEPEPGRVVYLDSERPKPNEVLEAKLKN